MNNIFSNRFIKYLACIMVVTQGMLIALVATFYLSNGYIDSVINDTSNSSFGIKLKSIPEEKNRQVLEFMNKYSNENSLLILKIENRILEDGSFGGIELNVMGDYKKTGYDLTYLGKDVVTEEALDKLFAKKSGYVIGIEDSSLKSVGNIPHFILGENFIVKKLYDKIDGVNTPNGIYKIIGLKADKIDNFLKGLEESSGVSKDDFIDARSGGTFDRGLKEFILLAIFAAHSVVLVSILVLMSIKSLKTLGVLVLKGWSRFSFLFKLFAPVFRVALVSIFLFIPYGAFLSENSFNTMLFFSTMILLGLINLLLTFLFVGFASLFVLIISPINAIRNRLPKLAYLISAFVIYIIFLVAVTVMCISIDKPFMEIKDNIKLKDNLAKVSDYRVLGEHSMGDDKDSYMLQSNKMNEDIFNWYKSISDEDGVYFIASSYISADILQAYKGNNITSVQPKNPFWLFQLSPNYLKKLGIDVSKEVLENARKGKRTFLVPESISEDERNRFEIMTREYDVNSIKNSDIKTIFNDKREFEFVKYNYNKPMFTWATSLKLDTEVIEPFIQVITPESMIFRESESIGSSGVENSRIKLEEKALKRYATTKYLKKFNLDDNNLKFYTIEKYVDGIQKNLSDTIKLFFIPIIMATIIVFVLLLVILYTYQMASKEVISVKKFLGYSTLSCYKMPIVLILVASLASIIAVLVFRSTIGISYMTGLFVVQLILLYLTIMKNQFRQLTQFLKG